MHPDTTLWINRLATKPWSMPILIGIIGIMIFLIALFFILGVRDFRKRNTCPKCGSHDFREVVFTRKHFQGSLWKLFAGILETTTEINHYCADCGHLFDTPLPEVTVYPVEAK